VERELSFLFDLGNVLISCDFEQGAEEIASQATRSSKEILEILDKENLICDFDQGVLSREEFSERITTLTGWQGSIEELEALWQRMLKPDHVMLGLLERLQLEGHPTYILSNINPFHTDYVRREFPLLTRTRGLIFSCECSLIKPDEEIFHHTARELGLDPPSTLFIDDRLENVEAARRVGFQALHHTDRDETIRFLEGLLLLE
jgi:HAD superfamily hydrolase (TIGR01509 family)